MSKIAECTGVCCAAFTWPRTISEVRKRERLMLDGATIAGMLVPLTPKEAKERHVAFGGTQPERFVWKRRGHYFTCRHWDEETRLCGIYDQRPAMCREYPYGKECDHGCGGCGGRSEDWGWPKTWQSAGGDQA